MQTIDQDELILNLKNRHEAGFSELYNTYARRIYNLAYRIIGNKEDAEDITQETIIRVYRHIGDFDGKSRLYTWIGAITKNLCYRMVKRKKKISFDSLELLINSARDQEIPADVAPLEIYHLANQVKEGCLTGLLRCLSFNQRAAFILHVLVFLSIKDVAEILEKSEQATKVLIHRARENLKGFLCRNCSLYDSKNPCHCKNLIGFSLKQGWIARPSHAETAGMDTRRIEEEIKSVREVAELYSGLSEAHPSEELINRIRTIIQNRNFIIFSDKKV